MTNSRGQEETIKETMKDMLPRWLRRSKQPPFSYIDGQTEGQSQGQINGQQSFEIFDPSLPSSSAFASDPTGTPMPAPPRSSESETYTMSSSRLSVDRPLIRGKRVSRRSSEPHWAPEGAQPSVDQPMMSSSGSRIDIEQPAVRVRNSQPPFGIESVSRHPVDLQCEIPSDNHPMMASSSKKLSFNRIVRAGSSSRPPVKGFRSESRSPWTSRPTSLTCFEKPLPPPPHSPYAPQSQRHTTITPVRSLEHSLATPFTKLSGPKDPGSSGFGDEARMAGFGGTGTELDPYLVDFLPGEGCNPYNWSAGFRWAITAYLAVNCLCPVFVSSSYIGGIPDLEAQFPGTSQELAVSGMTFYMLGQAFGPLLWAPLSEVLGRPKAFLWSFPLFVLFNLVGAEAKNITTILVVRFLSGIFGASPVTNLGGQIGDMWLIQDRVIPGGLAMLSPMLGPCIGPIVCDWVGQKAGFRAVFWVQFGFGLTMLVSWIFLIPETYAPTLLGRRTEGLRAEAAAAGTGEVFISKYEKGGKKPLAQVIKVGLGRPFALLFKEVIVWPLSLYLAVVYGILYLLFTAFPVIFVELRGWSFGMSGLGLLGIAIGMIIGFVINGFSRKLYTKARANTPAHLPVPPEVRLPTMCLGAVLAPIGLFWFAWTSSSNVHWIVPIIASIPFGTGFLLIFTAILLYLIDSYSIYAASALAANTVMRMVLGALFPLVADKMYTRLGVNWAGTLLAFLSLACAPIPFLFYRYGAHLRRRSKYAPSTQTVPVPPPSSDPEKGSLVPVEPTRDRQQSRPPSDPRAPSYSSPYPNQGNMSYSVPDFTLSDGFSGLHGFRGMNGSSRFPNAENEILPSPASTWSAREYPHLGTSGNARLSDARLSDPSAGAIYNDDRVPTDGPGGDMGNEAYESRDGRNQKRNRGVSMYSERERLVGQDQDDEREQGGSTDGDGREARQYERNEGGPVMERKQGQGQWQGQWQEQGQSQGQAQEQEHRQEHRQKHRQEEDPKQAHQTNFRAGDSHGSRLGLGRWSGSGDFLPLELKTVDGVDIGSGSLRDSFYGTGWWSDN